MKKFLLTLIITLSIFLFVGCNSNSSVPQNELNLGSTNDVYGFEAMSSISLLNSLNAGQTAPLAATFSRPSITLLGSSSHEVTSEQIDNINKYLGIMEQMLSDEKPLSVVNATSDRPEYTNMLTITTKDLNLNVLTYVLYFNEVTTTPTDDQTNLPAENEPTVPADDQTNVTEPIAPADDQTNVTEPTAPADDQTNVTEPTDEQTEVTEPTDEQTEATEPTDEQNEAEQQAVVTNLEGLLVIGTIEYAVTGVKKVEGNEVKVEFTSKLDNQNWVKVEQETENGEEQFKYTVSENGVISRTMIKLAQEDNETKLMLTFIQGNVVNKYQFKEEVEDGQKVIHIKCLDESISANIKVYVTVDPTTGEETYEYKYVETGKSFNKERHTNKHEDEQKGDKEGKDKEEHDNDEESSETPEVGEQA